MRVPLMPAAALAAPAFLVLAPSPAYPQPEAAPAPPARTAAAPPEPLAKEAALTAVLACRRMGYKTMATVVDTAGRPVAAMSADPELTPALAKGSVKRAAVAAEFHLTSRQVAEQATSNTAVYYILHDNPRLQGPEPGGVPLTGPENPKGAIGVAGSPDPAKDEACAQAGAAKIAQRLK